jgi:hypothetical protein
MDKIEALIDLAASTSVLALPVWLVYRFIDFLAS